MAEVFEVEANGQIYEVEADTPQQAATYARLLAAREQGVGQATAGAEQRNRQAQGTPAYPHLPLGVEMDLGTTEGKINAGIAAIPVAHGLVTAPLATVTGIGTGMVGEEAGNRFGRKLEEYGAPEGTSKVLGMAGGLGAGIYGGVKSNQVINWLKNMRPGGLLGAALEGVAPKAAATASASSTADDAVKALKAKEIEQRIADRAAKAARDAERHELQKQLLQRRLEGKPVPRAPKAAQPTAPPPAPTKQATAVEPEVLPDDAVAAVVEPIPEPTILPAGQRAMATNLGGAARPGPVATPEVDLEAVLRRSVEAAKAANAAKAAAAESPLRGPRLEVGAERVGKGVGMTKEDVRLATGPRLDEALGEASPILPDTPFGKIIDTMKALPKTGGFREAYVARATSGKTRWQVENIRRQLEHLGLLAPVAAAGGMARTASE